LFYYCKDNGAVLVSGSHNDGVSEALFRHKAKGKLMINVTGDVPWFPEVEQRKAMDELQNRKT
jgi:hypothetical protein